MILKRALSKATSLFVRVEKDPAITANFIQEPLILCNFCATVFRKEGPIHSEFLACPACGSIARERVIYQCILDEIERQKGESGLFFCAAPLLKSLRLLEFSPRYNPLRNQIYHEALGEYLASDFDLSTHRADIRMDLTCLDDVTPYSGHFDIVICAHVLEHIQDYKLALENLYRLLAPGGFLVLQVPLLERQYVKVTWDEFHGDNTRVFHRFGFDLQTILNQIFTSGKPVVGLLDFPITSSEIDPAKYDRLKEPQSTCMILGESKMRYFGLGCPDLCDAFLAYNDSAPIQESGK